MFKQIGLIFLLVGLLPLSTAHAGWIIEGSIGQGLRVHPGVGHDVTTLMVAPGYVFLDMLRLELGIAGGYGQNKSGDEDGTYQLRPMLTIAPPLIPLYGRVILATIRPFNSNREIAYGAALGLGGSIAGLGIFGEAAVLPRVNSGDLTWILEGRAGVSFEWD
jgi:hypothetical protein